GRGARGRQALSPGKPPLPHQLLGGDAALPRPGDAGQDRRRLSQGRPTGVTHDCNACPAPIDRTIAKNLPQIFAKSFLTACAIINSRRGAIGVPLRIAELMRTVPDWAHADPLSAEVTAWLDRAYQTVREVDAVEAGVMSVHAQYLV